MYDVRPPAEGNAAPGQLLEHGVNIGNLKIERRTSLTWLICRRHPNKQADRAALKETHLGRGRKEERKAKRVTVEDHCPIEVVDRYEHLGDRRLSEIHLTPTCFSERWFPEVNYRVTYLSSLRMIRIRMTTRST